METENTYTPPEIISGIDDDVIHQRMLANLPSDIDKTEGGFAHDFTRPAALEKAELLIALNDIIQIFFPEWSYGGYLDKLAQTAGLARKAATPSSGVITVHGAEGTTFPIGYKFCTPSTAIAANVEFESIEEKTIGTSGSVDIPVVCTESGTVGNVPSDCITLMVSPIAGVTAVTNVAAFTGGTEVESDDALRLRIMEKDRVDASSYVGNDSDYRRWALEVEGVGSCIVVPEWQGSGTGTVKLIIMDSNGDPANSTILQNVYDHIISPDNRENRLAPIGVILTVATATSVELDISAVVVTEADIDDITADIRIAVKEYFAEAKMEGTIRYTRIGRILSGITGVLDYSNLLINNATNNVSISEDEYPIVGTITLTDSSQESGDDV